MRVRKKLRLMKAIFWGLTLLLLMAACAGWFAYKLVTDSETIARLVRAQAARFLPGSTLETSPASVSILKGEVSLRNVQLRQRIDGRPFLAARIAWLSVRVDPRELMHGRVEPREVIISQPKLYLCQRSDGTWNLQGLIADPWPAQAINNPPPIVIRNGTVEMIAAEPPRPRPAPGADPAPVGVTLRLAEERPGVDDGVVRTRGTSASRGEPGPARAASPAPAATPPAVDDPSTAGAVAILREVNMRIEAAGDRLRFEGTATGDLFNKVVLEGTIDPRTGDVDLKGNLDGLTLSENLRRRLPPQAAPTFDAMALKGGDIDLKLRRLAFRPKQTEDRRLEYDASASLRGGAWECPKLPFSLNNFLADVDLKDGLLTIRRAEGSNGGTRLRAEGWARPGPSLDGPFDLRLDLLQLELDRRLQARTPEQFAELWSVFKPHGEVDAYVQLVRDLPAGPVGAGATVVCHDVGATYRHFAYPLEHLSGTLTLEKQQLAVDLHGLVGEGPARLTGKIDNPGPDAVVELAIHAEAVPVDDALLKAMPPDVRKVVNDFKPRGSVKGDVRVRRRPMVGPDAKPEGTVLVDALLDLNPDCEITWVGLPYTVRGLTGQLELHPDRWEFRGLRGRNGQATIVGNGRVERLPRPDLPNGEPPLRIDLKIGAEDLPFNEDLRRSLQPAWQKTWAIIDPQGTSKVDAAVFLEAGKPDRYHIAITPKPQESSVRLKLPRPAQPGVEPGAMTELRMEDVGGRFEFDNGKVRMTGVTFVFHDAPVRFEVGDVVVEDSGRFDLAVRELEVKDIRFGPNLRKVMPPLMAKFARRLDDGRPFRARGDLRIGWSGVSGEPAWCRWERMSVVLSDNSITSEVPLKHIQGQLEEVRGWSNGLGLEVHGRFNLASVDVMDQQVTQLTSAFHIERGQARFEEFKGKLLKGDLTGGGTISLEDSPSYSTSLRLAGARLEEYARTVPGHQSFRGALDAAVALKGRGSDIRSVQGQGDAHVTEGDLGEMNLAMKFVNFINSNLSLFDPARNVSKTAFDSADVAFRINQGTAILDPIKLTGTAFSLQGNGKRDPMGNLDIRLKVLYGRDRLHLPVVSDLVREVSAQIFMVHLTGTQSNPSFSGEALPQIQRLGVRRGTRDASK
ncbi:AsmA family protein [Aquisphaera insulae]|uniref:AsmA family protein n=1 Tax=Aquisphaera insulae TaxID=2712864 RepID=UPI0013EC3EA8|nr:AsmA-like C-terminal region-containing protein [Aquisphaera insulae]